MGYHSYTMKCDGMCDTCDCPESVRLPQKGQAMTDAKVTSRAEFDRWCAETYRSQAYLHTSATSGEWQAWQAGAAAMRAKCVDICETWNATPGARLADEIRKAGMAAQG